MTLDEEPGDDIAPAGEGEAGVEDHCDGDSGRRARRSTRDALTAVGVALLLPLLLYVVLRPENFGIVPNPLDPLFYTGYAINFDDILNAARDRHYFVSRWTSYLPGYIADSMVGPRAGRLLLRWGLASTALLALWMLGRGLGWRWRHRVLAATLLLTMPMFVRAFFTDYVEFTVVSVGLVLVCVCLLPEQTMLSATTAGVASAIIVVANPISVTAVLLPLAICIWSAGPAWTRRGVHLLVIAMSGSMVVLGGLALFRWRYDIPNVYQPSIDFIRTFEGRDVLKSPRREWLWHFTWLFAAPALVIVGTVLHRRGTVSLRRAERLALVLCGSQYAYQWIDQFVRDGNGLEISYYWSFAYPSFGVAFVLVCCRLLESSTNRVVAAAGAGWVALLLVGVPDAVRFPAGLGFFLIAGSAVALVVFSAGRRRSVAVALLCAFVGWSQVGAPSYDPTAYHRFNMSPRYDELFRAAGTGGEVVFDETIWFAAEMDRVMNDASTSFLPLGGRAGVVSAIYAPQVTGRTIGAGPDGVGFSEQSVAEIELGRRPIVAVLGPPDEVAGLMSGVDVEELDGQVVLDETHDRALGYRLVVMTFPDLLKLPFEFEATDLSSLVGQQGDDDVRAVEGEDAPGFTTYGPYVDLPAGNYSVTLRYRSSASPGTIVGGFDVFATEVGVRGAAELTGTEGDVGIVTVPFSVEGVARWEFRTSWTGVGELVIDSITLDHAP